MWTADIIGEHHRDCEWSETNEVVPVSQDRDGNTTILADRT